MGKGGQRGGSQRPRRSQMFVRRLARAASGPPAGSPTRPSYMIDAPTEAHNICDNMQWPKGRSLGLLIAAIGTIGVTPDAALLRVMEASGGATMVITVWRFIVSGCFNLAATALLQGGIAPLIAGVRSAPGPLAIGSAMVTVTNVGFVISLLKVDPTKALLLISLNPLWAALLGCKPTPIIKPPSQTVGYHPRCHIWCPALPPVLPPHRRSRRRLPGRPARGAHGRRAARLARLDRARLRAQPARLFRR
eukprot:4363821-Prymnesium_polylepis.1